MRPAIGAREDRANVRHAIVPHCGDGGAMVFSGFTIRHQGIHAMRFISTAFLAAGLVALSGCGGAAEQDVVANDGGDELYNLAPADLESETTLNELDTNLVLDNGTAEETATENAVENSQ